MIARKLPVEIEFYPLEKEFLNQILEWNTPERPITLSEHRNNQVLKIATLEGTYTAYFSNDVIIKGIRGEVYPCKKEIFEKTYEIIN